MNRFCILAGALALIPGTLAHAQSFNEIVGEALTVDCVAGSRSGTLTIPRTSLAQLPSAFMWQWTSPTGGLPILAADGTVLGTISGTVGYHTLYDDIMFDFVCTSGAADTRFTVRSANLANSFTVGATDYQNLAQLSDLNGDGATLGGLFASNVSQISWNGSPTASAIPGYSVGPGGSVPHSDNRFPLGSYFGTESLAMDFTLTAADSVSLRSFAIVSIPAPGTALLGLPALLLARRRR